MLAERVAGLPYQIETRLYRPATPEQALAFLEKLAQPVLEGDKERQVICANQLKPREVGPLVFRRHEGCYVPHTIKTEEGRRAVSSLTWQEAFETFAEQLGCNLEDPGDYHYGCRKGPRLAILREEREIPTNRENIFLLRVKERDTSQEGCPLILLGFEIRNPKAKRRWFPYKGEHIADSRGRTW